VWKSINECTNTQTLPLQTARPPAGMYEGMKILAKELVEK